MPPIRQDRGKIEQILNNLLSNAIKFTPDGGRIHVSARRDRRDDLRLSVADTGVGISDTEQVTVFEKFRQGSNVLAGGNAMRAIVDEFERRGYRWAYRVVDSWSFGLAQRRERVFLVASRVLDPAAVLLADDRPLARPATALGQLPHGFYWTEGRSGLGWAVDAVPTLKNGSTIGILGSGAQLLAEAIATNGLPTNSAAWITLVLSIGLKLTKQQNVTNAAEAVPAKVIKGPDLPLKVVVQEGQEN